MMEHIPIKKEQLLAKLDALGMPKDEQNLFYAYTFVRVISSELLSYAREVGNDYVYGIITRQEFEQEIENIRTLWGKARQLLGVDWILFSPEERDFFIMVYERRRQRRLIREQAKGR